MPAITRRATSAFSGDDVKSSTPPKRRLRSDSSPDDEVPATPPAKWKSPRRSINSSPNSPSNGIETEFSEKLQTSTRSPLRKSSENLLAKAKWNPRDTEQMRTVKEALHVSTLPSGVVCREEELKKVLDFCKSCVEREKPGSLYVCGCPGTGKTMVMEKVKQSLVNWSSEADVEQPEVLLMNCTSLSNTSEVFTKILQKIQPKKKLSGSTTALKHIQNIFAQDERLVGKRMLLLIVDELDYLITKDRNVIHELFMLTTLPYSRCILIGIANAIDLADRFLPKLQSLNCKPAVLTFRAYSKDQIQRILQERLTVLPYVVFQPQALELCSRKVAAASGDMRKALCVCRSSIEILESDLKEKNNEDISAVENSNSDQENIPATRVSRDIDVVQIHHMAVALSKAYRSPVVETIQSLPQHQQIILCSAVKLVRDGRKESTVGELNKSYEAMCKSTKLRSVGILELSSMCRALTDQGLLKLVQSQKGAKVTLKVDAADITFALQGVRFFRNCLQ